MDFSFYIPFKGCHWCYRLLPYGDFQMISVDGFCYLEIYKYHNHRYEIAGFFYLSRHLIRPRLYRTKRELFGAIQELLQEELSTCVQ